MNLKNSNYDNETSNVFNLKKELDYSISNADSIDSRVLNVCMEAEKNYLANQKTIREIQNIKKYNKKSITWEDGFNSNLNDEVKFRTPHEFFFLSSDSEAREKNRNNSENKIFQTQNTCKEINKNDSVNFNSKFQNWENVNIKNSRSSNGAKFSYQRINIDNNLRDKVIKETINDENYRVELHTENYLHNKLKISHRNLKSGKKCLACELKRK